MKQIETNDDPPKWLVIAARVAMAVAFSLCAAILMVGCAKKVYVPVERERTVHITDTVTVIKLIVRGDTVRERTHESEQVYDSVAPILDSLNRVIGWERWHFRERTKTDEKEIKRLNHEIDSLKTSKRDTVTEIVPQPYPVEKELSGWERVKIGFAETAVPVILVIGIVIGWRLRRRRKP